MSHECGYCECPIPTCDCECHDQDKRIAELTAQLKEAAGPCKEHDQIIEEIVAAKVVWATEDTPFTGPQVLALLDENEKLRDRAAKAEAALAAKDRQLSETTSLLQQIRGSEDCLCPCCMRLGAYRYVQESEG